MSDFNNEHLFFSSRLDHCAKLNIILQRYDCVSDCPRVDPVGEARMWWGPGMMAFRLILNFQMRTDGERVLSGRDTYGITMRLCGFHRIFGIGDMSSGV
jgi:hypothetical protein